MYVALLALTVIVYALVCAVYYRHRACSWFHPLTIYLAFHGIVFVLRPILSWYYGYTFIYRLYLFSPDDYAKLMTLVVVNVGLISFAFASLRFGNAPLAFRADQPGWQASHADAARAGAQAPGITRALARMTPALWLVSVPLLALAAYSLDQAWALRTSDLSTIDADLTTGTYINTSGNGYVQFAYISAATLLPMLAWAGRFRLWWLALAAAGAVLFAGVGIRGPIISLLVCLATLYLFARHRRAPDWRIVVVTVVGVLAFNAIGQDRGEEVRSLLIGGERTTTTQVVEQTAPLEGMDLGSLEFVEFLVDKVPRDTRSYEYFIDNLQVFTEPIPRTLWPGKPIGQPIRFFYLFDYGYPIGMTRSLPGEGWTQLGLAGVVLWCGLCGALCGAIYNRFARGRQTPVQIALYAAFMATLIVFYRDGQLVTLLRQGIFFVLPPLLWWLAAWAMGVRASGMASVPAGRAGRARMAAPQLAAESHGDAAAPAPVAPAAEPDLSVLPRSRRHPRRATMPLR